MHVAQLGDEGDEDDLVEVSDWFIRAVLPPVRVPEFTMSLGR